MGQVYNIPFGADFCDILAEKLLNETKDNALELSKYVVILPTARASRNLKKCFSQKSTNLILPQIISLNMLDEDNISLLGGQDIPQTLSDTKRGFILSQFVQKIKAFDLNKAQAMKLAFELGNLFDKIETQQLDIKDLDQIVPEEFAEHWQITLSFLHQVSSMWQDYLKEQNLVSKASQRNMILKSQSEIWEDQASKDNIIVAGFSSTIPAMLELMKTIYNLENGRIIIQGLDKELSFDELTEINYLYGVYEIINHIEIDKSSIEDWIELKSSRQELTSLMMMPSDKTTSWRTQNNSSEKTVKNLEYIECENEQNEAEVISIMLRKELEEKDKTISLVTPDRMLARCVASNLERWGIVANDSSGHPLQYTPIGNWLKLVLNMLVEEFAPVDFLACMKHPFASCGGNKTEFKSSLRKLEKEFRNKKAPLPLDDIKEKSAFFLDGEKHSFSDFLKQHISLCEELAGTDEKSGSEIIWQAEYGEECANFVHDLFENSTDEDISLSEYFSVFSLIMQGQQVRQKYGFHPRLSILGLTESRLAKSDVVIMGGLNEDIWPPAADVDGWMSRPMKKDFGMIAPDINIGLSGFDFANAFNFDKVYITRSKKSNNSISIKSRWVNRLDGVLKSNNLELPKNDLWSELAKEIDYHSLIETLKPDPCPHLDSRPKKISVSGIDVLRKDPYSFYAKKILGLYKMDDLEEDISNATKGNIIHKCLEEFIKAYPKTLPANAKEELINIGRKVFSEGLSNDNYFAFWWPRFENIADWFIEKETTRREIFGYENILTEEEGAIEIDGVKITSKADRIDIISSGVEIIDYKTGNPPSSKDMESLKYTQLPIEALIANQGGFNIAKAKNNVARISIWALKGKKDEDNKTPDLDIDDEMLDKTEQLLTNLIQHFNDPRTTYPAEPSFSKHLRYNDYEHLSRLKLWRDRTNER